MSPEVAETLTLHLGLGHAPATKTPGHVKDGVAEPDLIVEHLREGESRTAIQSLTRLGAEHGVTYIF